MADRFNAPYIITSDNPDEEEIEEIVSRSSSASSVVVATYNGNLNRGQVALVNRFAGRDVLCIALRNPYDLALVDKQIRTIACYSFTAVMVDVLERLLSGQFNPEGTLPIGLGGLHA